MRRTCSPRMTPSGNAGRGEYARFRGFLRIIRNAFGMPSGCVSDFEGVFA